MPMPAPANTGPRAAPSLEICAVPLAAAFQLSYQLEVPEDGVEHDKHAYVVGGPLNIVCATFGMLRIGTAKA